MLRQADLNIPKGYLRDFKMRLLALSTTEVSRLARYIWVVASLS